MFLEKFVKDSFARGMRRQKKSVTYKDLCQYLCLSLAKWDLFSVLDLLLLFFSFELQYWYISVFTILIEGVSLLPNDVYWSCFNCGFQITLTEKKQIPNSYFGLPVNLLLNSGSCPTTSAFLLWSFLRDASD